MMTTTPRILHIEDNLDDAELTRRELSRGGVDCELVVVSNNDQFLAALEQGPYDLVLSDSRVVGLDAPRAREQVRERLGSVPFVCLSGSSPDDALTAGITLVLKSDMNKLPSTVRQALSLSPAAPEATGADLLVEVVQRLSMARDLETLASIVRHAARKLTGADGATFVLREGDLCHYADEDAISPLWKGKRFPMAACISGWAMIHKEPVVIEDIYADDRIPHDAYRPTFVKSLAIVPIRRMDPVGAIGNYWARPYRPTEEQLRLLQALADTTAVAIENISLYEELERRVDLRTAELQTSNQELEAFTRAVSHDLRAPLRGVLGFTQLALEEGQMDDTTRDHLERAQRASERMQEMIDDLLRLSQVTTQPLRLRSTDLAGIAREVARDLQSSDPARKVSWIFPSQLKVECDPQLIRLVLENLLGNAFKFTARNTSAEIELGHEKSTYFVRDDGAGFDSDRATELFQPFHRLHSAQDFPGSGVGLSTVQRIVHRHGGHVWARSQPGRGATLYFTLAPP